MRMWLPMAVILMVLGSLGWEVIRAQFQASPNGGEDLRGPIPVTLTHPVGVSVMHPNGFDIRELPNGFVFQEAAAVRTPLRVAVGRGNAVVPAEHSTKDLPSGTIRFWLEKEPAGSGGPLWRLVGVVAVENGLDVVMEASQQREDGPPGFQRAWTIFQSVQEE